jgi:hypothetical protein
MNGAAWTPGATGAGVALDGVDDYVRIAHDGALDAFPLTASVWFKTTVTTGARGLVSKYAAASLNGYQIFLNNGSLCAWYFKDAANAVYDGTGCTLATPGYDDGAWHHVVFVVDALGGRLYVDGAPKASRPWTGGPGPASTTQEVALGHYAGASSPAFVAGTVDELRLYGRALVGEEVRQLYAAGVPPAIDASLIVHLKMDEPTGTAVSDSSGSGNAGSLMNGAARTNGISGKGIALDGMNDYVRIPHKAALDAFPLTAALWFKTTASSGLKGLVNKYVASSNDGYQIFLNKGTLCAWYFKSTASAVYDGTGCTLATPGYNDGRWHHVVFVVDATGGRLYVDGVLRATRPWTGPPGPPSTTREIRLGHYTTYLAATIDELRVYSRALTAAEAAQLWSSGRPAP